MATFYTKSRTIVIKNIPINRRVREGNTISSKLFIAALDNLTYLRFANDIKSYSKLEETNQRKSY